MVGNHIVGCADDTTIYVIIPRPFSRSQLVELMNQYLVAINSWCLKWHIRLKPKKKKSIVGSRSWTSAFGYSDLTLGGTELEEVKGLRFFGATLDSKFTFETHLAAMSLMTKY